MRLFLTVVISMAGVAVFHIARLPLPWLLGPMFGCLAAAFAGAQLQGNALVSNAMRTVLGVAIGAAITPAVVGRMGEMALSIALIPPFVLLIGLAGYPYFRRLWGFDPATSYYAAMPGGLQDMLIFGEEAGGSPRILSLIHATRVLIIVTGLPFALSFAMTLDFSQPPGDPARDLPLSEGLWMLALAAAGWAMAHKVGLFGASILGPMIAATAASLLGILHYRPPSEALIAAQFVIGMTVGVKYVGITGQELRRVVTSAVGYSLIVSALGAGVAALVVWLGLAPPVDALLAFAPGGQAEMVILALVAGADVAFVVTHHITRVIVVILGAPLIQRWLG